MVPKAPRNKMKKKVEFTEKPRTPQTPKMKPFKYIDHEKVEEKKYGTKETKYNLKEIKKSNGKHRDNIPMNIHKNIGKKPALIHSNTMPVPAKTKVDLGTISKKTKSKLKRRHTEDWTSKANLLTSLKNQDKIRDQLFPSRFVPEVNLEEMFNGKQFIRVHRKIRPINVRRETQLFHVSI